jgi:lipopolysaccharide/colanic/teichoic acid biosynthesis glycosyltransferase
MGGQRLDAALKRAMDIGVAGAGLLVLAPFLLVLAVLVRAETAGPVFYRAERVGRGGKRFAMLKLRTMVVGADKGASSTPDDDPRVTRVGRWMRRYKVDEIPQLWNVLVGEMSLVGPRPQVPWVVDGYSEEERLVLSVRPGITDPASIRFANEGEILRGHPDPDAAYFELIHPEKMRLAVDYVRRRTVLSDIRVLVATITAPLQRRSDSDEVDASAR